MLSLDSCWTRSAVFVENRNKTSIQPLFAEFYRRYVCDDVYTNIRLLQNIRTRIVQKVRNCMYKTNYSVGQTCTLAGS